MVETIVCNNACKSKSYVLTILDSVCDRNDVFYSVTFWCTGYTLSYDCLILLVVLILICELHTFECNSVLFREVDLYVVFLQLSAIGRSYFIRQIALVFLVTHCECKRTRGTSTCREYICAIRHLYVHQSESDKIPIILQSHSLICAELACKVDVKLVALSAEHAWIEIFNVYIVRFCIADSERAFSSLCFTCHYV